MSKRTETVFHLATFLWILSFAVSLIFGGRIGMVSDVLCCAIGVFFIVELVIAYRHAVSIREFIRGNWHEVLMLIPVFRCVRLLKYARRMRRILLMLDNVIEGIDVILRIRAKKYIGACKQYLTGRL